MRRRVQKKLRVGDWDPLKAIRVPRDVQERLDAKLKELGMSRQSFFESCISNLLHDRPGFQDLIDDRHHDDRTTPKWEPMRLPDGREVSFSPHEPIEDPKDVKG